MVTPCKPTLSPRSIYRSSAPRPIPLTFSPTWRPVPSYQSAKSLTTGATSYSAPPKPLSRVPNQSSLDPSSWPRPATQPATNCIRHRCTGTRRHRPTPSSPRSPHTASTTSRPPHPSASKSLGSMRRSVHQRTPHSSLLSTQATSRPSLTSRRETCANICRIPDPWYRAILIKAARTNDPRNPSSPLSPLHPAPQCPSRPQTRPPKKLPTIFAHHHPTLPH